MAMMKTFTIILCAIIGWIGDSTLIVQPWPLKVERTGICCVQTSPDYKTVRLFNASEVLNLQTCLHKQQNLLPTSSEVSIVTFSSSGVGDFSIPDIEEFSVYQRGVIAAYAETNGYVYHHVSTPVNDAIFENSADARWLKIKILLDALDGWAKDTRWIIWIDADAIVLDFNLKVEELGRRYPQADILASADIRMGLINTGVLMLRNTPWMRQFLHQWWYGPSGRAADDRASQAWRSVCDQDAFDRLYSHHSRSWTQGEPRISDKVKVLPMDAVNSHPPAIVHQRADSAVLHLMGETTAVRRELFRRAWGAVCAARSGGVLPVQLGLHTDILLVYARSVYTEEAQSQLRQIQNASVEFIIEDVFMSDDSAVGTEDAQEARLHALLVLPLQELSRSAHHLCDILSHLHSVSSNELYQSEAVRLRNHIYESVTARVETVREMLANLTTTLMKTHSALQVLDSEPELRGSDKETRRIELMLAGANGVRRRRLLLGVHVQLLKRAAEAGNDLFGVEPAPVQKLRVASAVLDILNDLEGQVDERSKYVPQHMRALMHQSLGVLEQAMAGGSETEHTNNISKQEVSLVHLREAHKHFLASVSIFRSISSSSHPHVDDSSFLMEVSMSLQLLAGITCSLGWYREGVTRWEEAIEQARASLRGIELGVRFDNLAAVLYNAAVCHSATGNRTRVDLLLAEAVNITDKTAGSHVQHTDNLFSTSTAKLRRQILELHSKNTDSPNLSLERDRLTNSAQSTTHGQGGQGATNIAKPKLGVMRPIIDLQSGKVSYVLKELPGFPVGAAHADGDGEEWEECELDEPCDEFEVEVSWKDDRDEHVDSVNTATDGVVHGMQGGSGSSAASEVQLGELDVDVEGMDADEVQELKEVRERFARQQKKQKERGVIPLPPADARDMRRDSSSSAASDTLTQLASQLTVLLAAHEEQGKIIDKMMQEIKFLRGV